MRKNNKRYNNKYHKLSTCGSHLGTICIRISCGGLFINDQVLGTSTGRLPGPIFASPGTPLEQSADTPGAIFASLGHRWSNPPTLPGQGV